MDSVAESQENDRGHQPLEYRGPRRGRGDDGEALSIDFIFEMFGHPGDMAGSDNRDNCFSVELLEFGDHIEVPFINERPFHFRQSLRKLAHRILEVLFLFEGFDRCSIYLV